MEQGTKIVSSISVAQIFGLNLELREIVNWKVSQTIGQETSILTKISTDWKGQ